MRSIRGSRSITQGSLFYDKDTLQPATAEQMMADWVTASNILRTSYPNSNLKSPPTGEGYADKCQLRMYPEKVKAKRDELMALKLDRALKDVAALRGFYGYPGPGAGGGRELLLRLFADEGPQPLSGACGLELRRSGQTILPRQPGEIETAAPPDPVLERGPDHRANPEQPVSFWDQLPLSPKSPELIPWKPWTRAARPPSDGDPGSPAILVDKEPDRPSTQK
jgi:hypothetical protein